MEAEKYLKLGYNHLISHAIFYLLLLVSVLGVHLSTTLEIKLLWDHLSKTALALVMIHFGLVVFLVLFYVMEIRARKIYMLDFACFKPGPEYMCSKERQMELMKLADIFCEESLEFQRKIMERSGLGDKTYGAKALLRIPPNPCVAEARKEAAMVMFGAIDKLLAKISGEFDVKDIGILVVNCSLFVPTPSLSSMIVNHYKLGEDVLSYNLGGMGCSAGVIGIDLAKHLLQVRQNTYALLVSTENLTLNWYSGNNKSMLISNCLFRMGGSAVLLSNNHTDRHRSKYELLHTLRTHKGADDESFRCLNQQEDENGILGVTLSKNLIPVAGKALNTNITALGSLVFPKSEQLMFHATLLAKKVFKNMKIKTYVPDFESAFQHFCIHPGGRAVLDEIQKNLKLSEYLMEPSKMSLYRFGNTSSSSLWYELAYCEAKGRVKKGDKTWQIGFGSGFKCNSAVWRALKTIKPGQDLMNPWIDEIDEFPVDVSNDD